MKKILLLSALLVLGGALCASAETYTITAYTGSATAKTPLALMTVTRTTAASGAWDCLEVHLSEWLVPSYQTGGTNGVGNEVNVITGTFAVTNPATEFISLTGSNTTWKSRVTWNYAAGTPTIAAPQSFVNFESTAGTLTRTGASTPGWTSFWGGYFGNTDGSSNLQVVDTTPAGNPDLDDLKDETLFCKLYVTAGANYTFTADPNLGTGETLGTLFKAKMYCFFDTTVPEPGTIVLLGTGLMGLLCYAWRKRK